MKLVRYLANLGYGSRREVERLIGEGRVRRADGSVLGARDTAFHDDLRVDDAPLDGADAGSHQSTTRQHPATSRPSLINVARSSRQYVGTTP